MSGEVPEGWTRTTLAALADITRGVSWRDENETSKATAGALPVLGIRNVQQSLKLDETVWLAGLSQKAIASSTVRSGDILMVGSNGNPARIGNAVRIDVPGVYLYASLLFGVRPDEKRVDGEFLFHLIRSSAVQQAISDTVQGSTGLANLKITVLRDIPILLPEIDEQRRIAQVLRSVDAAIATNRAVASAAAQTLKLLSDKLLVANAERTGTMVKFGDLIDSLEAGVSVNSESRHAEPDEIGILKTSCVSAGYFEPAEHKAVLASEGGRVRVPVKGESIIISRMNTFELVGANAFVEADHSHLYLPDRLWLLKSNSRVRIRWLAFYMRTAKFREQVISIATGTSGSMKNISKGRLNDLTVFIPDDQQQADDIAGLSAVEAAWISAKNIDACQQVAAATLRSDLLSGRVRVPA